MKNNLTATRKFILQNENDFLLWTVKEYLYKDEITPPVCYPCLVVTFLSGEYSVTLAGYEYVYEKDFELPTSYIKDEFDMNKILTVGTPILSDPTSPRMMKVVEEPPVKELSVEEVRLKKSNIFWRKIFETFLWTLISLGLVEIITYILFPNNFFSNKFKVFHASMLLMSVMWIVGDMVFNLIEVWRWKEKR